jgi:hypothetical protein
MQVVHRKSCKEEIAGAIASYRIKYPEFEFAYETYLQEYGADKLNLNSESTDLSGSVDSLAIFLGRNCTVFYSDSNKTLRGSLGTITFKPGSTYIIGRRQPQDQKLACWGPEGSVDLEEYNSRASIIPSRVHGAFVYTNEGVCYLDLGSSSGTVVVGDSATLGPFVKVYDPGSTRHSIRIDRVSTVTK